LNSIHLDNYLEFSLKAKSFASEHNPCVILDSCEISPQRSERKYKLVLAFGGNKVIEPKANKLDELYSFWQNEKCWLFGVIGYDLKNELEVLSSENSACFGWPEVSFFIPENIVTISWDNTLNIFGPNPTEIYKSILNFKTPKSKNKNLILAGDFQIDLYEEQHYQIIELIKEEIRNGNVYELNLCSRFVHQNATLEDPYAIYCELTELSPTPFSAFLKIENKTVISASPERYLLKHESRLVSQPIKGTRPRSKSNSEDIKLMEDLRANAKDRAENVMIVDLVRNDLAHVSIPGKVKVDELFGIYSYSHVHQMVSTISSFMEKKYTWKDAIRNTFPMGSMTGTPKIAAMQWIEKFELSKREWYSGALGYIDPAGNFDFNVLIRSLFHDSTKKTLAYYAGGAITIDSDASEEFNELMIKTKAIQTLLKKYLP
jgi:para-aminobenzoate synthetase component 1